MVDRVDISDLLTEYVICRTLGHSWDDNPAAELDGVLFRQSAGAMALRCTRCETERFDYLDAEMAVARRYYRYPPRYGTITGQGRRPNLRGELLNRSVLIQRYRARRNRQ